MVRSRAGHLFGLDLARCAAVLLVLGNHCGLAFTAWNLVERPGYLDTLGYYGVELFFVLSGFLIGRILLDAVAVPPTVRDWLVFMARRWMRTLPLYVLWLAVLAVFWLPGQAQYDWPAAWQLVRWYAWFGQNLAWPSGDWFAVSWSLSIEEWFYLTFSLALFACAHLFGGRRAMALTLTAFLAAPLLLRLAQSPQENWNEYLHKAVVFRLDAIACGVLAAVLLRSRTPTAAAGALLFLVGAVAIALQCSPLLPIPQFIGPRLGRALGFDVSDLALAMMLPALVRLPKPPAWLGTPVRLFAAQSYGTYLMHYTLIEWVGYVRITTHWSGPAASWITAALILVLPAASWHLFERPLLALRPSGRGGLTDVRLSPA